MKKELKLQKNEPLDKWCLRLANYCGGRDCKTIEIYQILREVSITSYTHGSDDCFKVISKR